MSRTATEVAASRSPARWRADLALAFVALLWGTTFVVVKQALNDISTMPFLAVRFWVASMCMAIIFTRRFRKQPATKLWRGFLRGSMAGIFLWLGYALQTFGLVYTSAGKSGLLTGAYIVLVPLFSAAIYQRRPQLREWAGILMATAGMVILTLPSISGQFRMNRGDLLTIGCAVAFAFQILVLGYYTQRELFEPIALGQIVATALLSTIFCGVAAQTTIWSGKVIFAIVLTGVFATALAFALQTWAQQYTTPTRTALIFALEPVFAVLTAVLVAGEALTTAALLGGALIFAGILAVELKPSHAR